MALDLLLSIRETIAAAPPKATDRLRDDELPIVEWLSLQHAKDRSWLEREPWRFKRR